MNKDKKSYISEPKLEHEQKSPPQTHGLSDISIRDLLIRIAGSLEDLDRRLTNLNQNICQIGVDIQEKM